MKRRIYSKVSIFVCIALLFCCMPFRVVKASNVLDQSKPIFGLTADDVVEKYNQLSSSQKSQVLRALGNTSIFSNSLFGNIFNSTFGVLDDAIEKIGDLFFQANGVIYKLGSSALSWVSRLIDKVFNNDLNDLNISQPVVNDFYLNTRDLTFLDDAFFSNGHVPLILYDFTPFVNALYYPLDCEYIFACRTNYTDLNFCYGFKKATYLDSPYSKHSRIIVDLVYHRICFADVSFTLVDDNLVMSSYGIPTYYSSYGGYWRGADFNFDYTLGVAPGSTGNWSERSGLDHLYPSVVDISNDDYLSVFRSWLNMYFSWADSYVLKTSSGVQILPINHDNDEVDLTNNTYYNYIYNIPNQTPLNVFNIVSNTSIDYSPVDNIAYYLPDQYNIEQNFSVVNNYYISSGSAITTGSVIDVNLVSPSVIDVRITNPEDISNLVENNTIKQIINNNEFNAGDLNLNTTISTVIDSSNDSLSVVSNDSVGLISALYSCIPAELMGLYVVEVIVGIAVIWLNVVNHKHK